jgi:hypothetical protein
MAFKMKGYNYPGESPVKQSYAGKNWNKAVKAKGDADNILKDPTSEGALDIATGATDVLKEGQHKADRIANFGGKVAELGKLAKGALDKKALLDSADEEGKPEELKGKTPDTGLLEGLENYGKDSGQSDKAEQPKNMPAEVGKGGDAKEVKLDDKAQSQIGEASSKWVKDALSGLLGGGGTA